jgi:ribosomal protein L11 methyltransferase
LQPARHLPGSNASHEKGDMTGTYQSLTVDLPDTESEAAQDLLHEAGAMGLEVRDRETPTMPGVRAPSVGEAIVVAYFEDAETAEAARAELAEAFPSARMELAEEQQQDWSNAWKAHIKSVQVGRLWVGPPWDVQNAPSDKVRLVIEPKMAFGTGDHPTTSLCLGAVDAYMGTHPGADVLDVGTGTGVLAIAAKKLGGGRVVGTDNDPVSVELSRENAELNGTPEVELSGKELTAVEGTFDLVVANILANTLIELAPLIVAKVKDKLLLAGVLSHQKADVEAAYVNLGLVAEPGAQQGEWVRLDFHRAK